MANSRFVKLVDNVPLALKFAEVPPEQDDSGQWGPRFNYIVNGSKVFSATAYLADQINATLDTLPPGSDRTLTITKTKNRQGKVRYNLDVGAQVPLSAMPPKPAAQQASNRDFNEIVSDYASCLFHAKLICEGQFDEGQFSNEDVRSVATTLFIEANRAGLKIPALYDQDTPVEDDEDDGVLDDDLPFDA